MSIFSFNKSLNTPLITHKAVNTYGYISISVMLVLLVLVWFEVVPKSLYIPLFLVAAALFGGRLVLRVLLVRQLRRKNEEQMRAE
ncbi:MAG: hypothetical protein O7D34_04185 [Ignavibacteria bacterium]|nr:hypothetical protein [Ignavibacteria bacterium]